MEIIFYGALSAIWWATSLSVLLPFVLLLKFHKGFRDRWFSWLLSNVLGPVFNRKLQPGRQRAFEILKSQLPKQRTDYLEVLEIGIGGGENLQYYPPNCNLTALDMNATFETYFTKNQKKHPEISYKRTVISKAENMKDVFDSSMDIIVCTYVLCSVDDVAAVLSEVKRVLKKGGKFVFVEHVAYPETEWSNSIQRCISPLWHLYFDGCYPNRNTAQQINAAKFSNVVCETIFPDNLVLFIRPQIVGVATM